MRDMRPIEILGAVLAVPAMFFIIGDIKLFLGIIGFFTILALGASLAQHFGRK